MANDEYDVSGTYLLCFHHWLVRSADFDDLDSFFSRVHLLLDLSTRRPLLPAPYFCPVARCELTSVCDSGADRRLWRRKIQPVESIHAK